MQFKLLGAVHFIMLKYPQIQRPNSELSSCMQMSAKTIVAAAAAAFLFYTHLYFPTAAHLYSSTTPLAGTLFDLTMPPPLYPLSADSTSIHHQYGCRYNPLCDDFPPDFPPADTPALSIFCVDPNGCCDFTTVQAAVNAVPNHSSKRNVVWINRGIYL
jgi:pectin methylesterase-like acyl-CoA thioesterase